ncbi:14549_t:CDS:2 [Acaulospora colombiana]|uniref:14549_t:CDS:1 n=1 Tax=Acaulospora colombiana TaxID=27376 RepID=A0ACA9KDW3_9GLOM|nr:14549_t:CDS:2 [Acaulospora colombiana]
MISLEKMKVHMKRKRKMVVTIKINNIPEDLDQTIDLADAPHGLDHHIIVIAVGEVDHFPMTVEDIIGRDPGVDHVQLPEIVGNDPSTKAGQYQGLDLVNVGVEKFKKNFRNRFTIRFLYIGPSNFRGN